MKVSSERRQFLKFASLLGGGLVSLADSKAGAREAGSIIYRDDFLRFDRKAWAVEAEAGDPGAAAMAQDGALLMDAQRGLTVWLRTQLIGHYEISYTRSVLMQNRPQDWPHERLSDMNCFWEAQLADGGPLFARSGKLEDYDKLRLFYAGIGGNTNTTTRFRYYDGSGARKLLQEYTAPAYLLQANRPYRVRIVVDGGGTRLYLDEMLLFSAQGPMLGGGYFGFRSTQSRHKIEGFAVRRIA
jgi:hypothetical protein